MSEGTFAASPTPNLASAIQPDEVPRRPAPAPTPTSVETLRDVTAAAASIFASTPRRRVALTYLRQRGIDASALSSKWILGYAPAAWTNLVDKLRRDFPEDALLAAGVARRSSRGTLIDTFRDRIVFGIRTADGTVAGFIGRDQSGHPHAPKYLNTHQHPLFDKGSLLFGMNEGVVDNAATQPVIVEGPIDVLAIAGRQQATGKGRLLPLAPCGTALSETQARTIADLAFKTCSPVVVAMDGDVSGRTAAINAGEQLRKAGLDVRLATLPNGADPADYLARSADGLDVFQPDCGVSLLTMRVRNAVADQGDRIQWIEGRLAALRSLTNHLASYPPSYTATQIGWMAEVLDLNAMTVTSEIVDAYRRNDRHAPQMAPHHNAAFVDAALTVGR